MNIANNRSADPAVSVSIVIPAYNEERHIAACLQSIAAQTVQPFEVIVVDNNSTDQTVAIARRFPFVKVVHEARQGVAFARDCGFNAARGSIIGRIDADSILTTDWVQTVQTLFSDPTLDAASGIVHYRDVSMSAAFDMVDLRIRRYLAARMEQSGEQFLYGVNMALRRSVWRTVRDHVCHERTFHEDQDLAIHLSERSKRIIFTPAMQASISPRQAAAGPREFLHYVWSNSKVYEAHNRPSVRYINRIALAVSCMYVPIHIMYRGYSPKTGRFSFTQVVSGGVAKRVSPISETV